MSAETLPQRLIRRLDDELVAQRVDTMERTLAGFSSLFEGKTVLDFGASRGTSSICLIQHGARRVVGVEPERARVLEGVGHLSELKVDRVHLLWLRDTTRLPFRDASFAFALANAVLEHIPEPRQQHIRELWRVVEPGGHLMIAETPNRYLPLDMHTTGLWWVPWLPCRLAYRYAKWRGAYDKTYQEWRTSGWRGLGYRELVGPLTSYAREPADPHWRHDLLAALGLPAQLLDPYPIWVFRKKTEREQDA